jgi:hypothetical protein
MAPLTISYCRAITDRIGFNLWEYGYGKDGGWQGTESNLYRLLYGGTHHTNILPKPCSH